MIDSNKATAPKLTEAQRRASRLGLAVAADDVPPPLPWQNPMGYQTVRYSHHYKGLLFGFHKRPNWDSAFENEYETEESAAKALAWYAARGLRVRAALRGDS